jgi:hypothetical protein
LEISFDAQLSAAYKSSQFSKSRVNLVLEIKDDVGLAFSSNFSVYNTSTAASLASHVTFVAMDILHRPSAGQLHFSFQISDDRFKNSHLLPSIV